MSCSLLLVDTGVQTKWPLQQLPVPLALVPSAGQKAKSPIQATLELFIIYIPIYMKNYKLLL